MCLYPKLIKNKKYSPNKKNGGVVPICKDMRCMVVPVGCGVCLECRKMKAREWQVRLLEDVRHNQNGVFVTLTFSNESIKYIAKKVTNLKLRTRGEIKSSWVDKNGKLCHRYNYIESKIKIDYTGYDLDNAIATYGVRSFLERWRKKHKKSARHWLVTELGHNGTENIHLHGFIWTDKELSEIKNIWKWGYVWIGEKNITTGKVKNYVNEQTVNYCMKYVSKVDFQHKYYMQKILCSAGIGAGYMNRIDVERNKYRGEDTREYYTTRTGHQMSLPIYWRNKIYSEDERESLWIHKLDKEIRYVCGEKVELKKVGIETYYKLLKWHRRRAEQLGYRGDTRNWEEEVYENKRRNLMIKNRVNNTNRYAIAIPEVEYTDDKFNYKSTEFI